MLLSHILLAGFWILYCVLHSVLASLSVKRRVQTWAGRAYRHYRLFYTLFAAAALAALIIYQVSVETYNLYRPTATTTIAGGVLSFFGLGLMLHCIKKYFMSLSGLKSLFQESPAAELMISGVHRYMRHPLYTGTFLAIWGMWLLFPSLSLLLADAVITFYTLYAIRLEEKKLVAEFGDAYKAYQQQVPKLFPRF